VSRIGTDTKSKLLLIVTQDDGWEIKHFAVTVNRTNNVGQSTETTK